MILAEAIQTGVAGSFIGSMQTIYQIVLVTFIQKISGPRQAYNSIMMVSSDCCLHI